MIYHPSTVFKLQITSCTTTGFKS